MAPPGRYAGHLGIGALFQRAAWCAALSHIPCRRGLGGVTCRCGDREGHPLWVQYYHPIARSSFRATGTGRDP